MKEKVIIKRLDKVLFSGKILNIPMKEESIVKKSIEVFGDEDPCIIHMSFCVKELVSVLLDIFEDNNTTSINVSNYLEKLSFLNFEELSNITIELVRKRK